MSRDDKPRFRTISYGRSECMDRDYIGIPKKFFMTNAPGETMFDLISEVQLYMTEVMTDLRLLEEFLIAQQEDDE